MKRIDPQAVTERLVELAGDDPMIAEHGVSDVVARFMRHTIFAIVEAVNEACATDDDAVKAPPSPTKKSWLSRAFGSGK